MSEPKIEKKEKESKIFCFVKYKNDFKGEI